MRDELSQAELNHIFYGEKPKLEIEFYEKEVLDPAKSKAAGHRVMRKMDYVHLKCEREKSEIHRPVQEEDHQRFAELWKAYEERRNEPRELQDTHTERPSIGAAFAQTA